MTEALISSDLTTFPALLILSPRMTMMTSKIIYIIIIGIDNTCFQL